MELETPENGVETGSERSLTAGRPEEWPPNSSGCFAGNTHSPGTGARSLGGFCQRERRLGLSPRRTEIFNAFG